MTQTNEKSLTNAQALLASEQIVGHVWGKRLQPLFVSYLSLVGGAIGVSVSSVMLLNLIQTHATRPLSDLLIFGLIIVIFIPFGLLLIYQALLGVFAPGPLFVLTNKRLIRFNHNGTKINDSATWGSLLKDIVASGNSEMGSLQLKEHGSQDRQRVYIWYLEGVAQPYQLQQQITARMLKKETQQAQPIDWPEEIPRAAISPTIDFAVKADGSSYTKSTTPNDQPLIIRGRILGVLLLTFSGCFMVFGFGMAFGLGQTIWHQGLSLPLGLAALFTLAFGILGLFLIPWGWKNTINPYYWYVGTPEGLYLGQKNWLRFISWREFRSSGSLHGNNIYVPVSLANVSRHQGPERLVIGPLTNPAEMHQHIKQRYAEVKKERMARRAVKVG